MSKLVLLVAPLALALPLAACGGGDLPSAGGAARNENASAATGQPSPLARADSPVGTAGDLGVVSSHGGQTGQPASGAGSGGAAGAASDRDLVKTAELDKRIKDAAEKAKVSGASAADRKAAADAYIARGNVYFNAGQPRLYKYALADFKQAVRYDPQNDEAREKIKTIEDIYASLGRPIPEVPEDQ
jgi:tetratricopeptide (TPR) repeat protein